MLSEQERNKIIADLRRAKEEVIQIKIQLKKANFEKESWFKKKAAVSTEIKDKINSVQELKKVRNSLTSEVKETKNKRDELNKKISDDVKLVNDLRKQIIPVEIPVYHKRENPVLLKKKIEAIETKIETEPMSFDKEQKLQKEIKQLKKKYQESQSVQTEFENVKSKTKELNKLKKEANKFHKDMQKQARESQEKHEQLIECSKEIDLLRDKEKEVHNKFMDQKQSYIAINEELKKKLDELNKIKETLESHDIQLEEFEQEKKKLSLKEKTKEVKDKIRKGGKVKLTTEDLLIMQQGKN